MTGRLPGHPGSGLANILWSMETKHNASQAKRTSVPLWLCSEWIVFILPDFFALREQKKKKNPAFWKLFSKNICHLDCSHESGETIAAPRRGRWILWGHEFPITSESDIDCSLTLFERAVVSFSLRDAVRGFQGALLGLLCLFVGRFRWGKEMTLMQGWILHWKN